MKRLLLIGGGHAHVHVLDALARQPYPETEVTLVSPYPRQIYSGMLPGWISGYYDIKQCAIPIDLLAQRAGVRFVESACTNIDVDARQIHCANGETISFDLVSIDSGPTVDLDRIPGANEFALPIRPIEGFVAAWPRLLERARNITSGFALTIVGNGAAGTELAFAIQERFVLEQLNHAQVILVGSNKIPLSGLPAGLRNTASNLLKNQGITHLGNRRVVEFFPGHAKLSDGSSIECNASLIVTGAAAPAWPAKSGLACDENGFIRVTKTLQSQTHPFVFAAGDVAAYTENRPKSGVYAVRAGPILTNNLRSACANLPLQMWKPQEKALYLISTGKHHALAAWGPLSTNGNWVWRWKDRIDRRFMQRFS